MSDLPDWLQRQHDEMLAHRWLDEPYKVKADASAAEEALRAQQYLAAQAYHIRKALDRIVGQLSAGDSQ